MNNVLLLILDGWGESSKKKGNAISFASTPNMDYFSRNYPRAQLKTAGEAVGLPPGQMGNSEVGHLNLGAGRIVYQELTRITKEIKTGHFFNNPVLLKAMQRAKEAGSALHLMGLTSDGGVHSHIDHLLALLKMARRQKVEKYFVHAILDGRDTLPFGAGLPRMEAGPTVDRLAVDRELGALIRNRAEENTLLFLKNECADNPR